MGRAEVGVRSGVARGVRPCLSPPSRPSPATASVEGRLIKGGPFPASATAEGAQFNVPPSPRQRESVHSLHGQFG